MSGPDKDDDDIGITVVSIRSLVGAAVRYDEKTEEKEKLIKKMIRTRCIDTEELDRILIIREGKLQVDKIVTIMETIVTAIAIEKETETEIEEVDKK